jgi:hypothetical protein
MPSSFLPSNRTAELLDLVSRLLHPLSFLPAAVRLPSTGILGTLQTDLFRLLLASVVGDLDLDRVMPLLIAALDTSADDSLIWAEASLASAEPD